MLFLNPRHLAWLVALLVASAAVTGVDAWPDARNIKNLVAFGDSYTDSTNWIPTGGTTWPEYVASYANITLYPFAISGATCSNKLTPRWFRDVTRDELGMYFNMTANGTNLSPTETVYSLWIGTNDVGSDQLVTGQSTPGVSIVDVSACAVDVIKTLYKSGARNFLFQNLIPLDQTPMYAANSYPDRYWTADRNTTQWNVMMKELVASGNALTRLMITAVAPTLPGATIGYFDSYALFNDIYTYPARYLNGTAPLNVTGPAVACVYSPYESTSEPGVCTIANGSDRDSFLWYDELHPSEQADRVVARAVTDVIQGKSERWTTFYRGPGR